ncbi:MAG: (E)-4-hydroxy-3-methylbut-2-enyl-diphosphate synthase [Bacteroidales bacterium]|nr:(E)-4-hydroxy-3-methylbut-2-enyl-diphosphate synthase [Bacteroidales bacterium]
MYTQSLTNYHRRQSTFEVKIGNTVIGGNHPVKVQTMCNTSTADVEGTVAQIVKVAKTTTCDIIRVTVPSLKDVEYLRQIKKCLNEQNIDIPLVADVHFNSKIAFECAGIVEKVRINPGNFCSHTDPCLTEEAFNAEGENIRRVFSDFLDKCVENNCAVRIGTNHGSLSARVLNRYGDTPEGMVFSVMEFLCVAVEKHFNNIAISLKSSNPFVAIRAARLLVEQQNQEEMAYPLHLGVTEAGEGTDGRLKSAAGIAPLLCDGIGGTIRVSLTEDPEFEILPGRQLVDYTNWRSNHTPLPEIPLFYDPFHYQKRESIAVGKIGGNNIATVALYADKPEQAEEYSRCVKQLMETKRLPDVIITPEAEGFTFIDEDTDFSHIENNTETVYIAAPKNRNKIGAFRYIFYQLQQRGIKNPVLICPDMGETNPEYDSFAPVAEAAGIFIDGFGDGICLCASRGVENAVRMGFDILQISRLRISGNEYVSCPGCGRTLYDLQSTVKKIKAATAKYSNLKIAVMGCIVNGPGEMADADFGYVGDGIGKISLYKNRQLVKKSIPQEQAVDELIKLIENSN